MAVMLTFFVTLTPSSAGYVGEVPMNTRSVSRREISLSYVGSRSPSAYAAVAVSHNGQSLGSIGRMINGEVYVPIRKFVESISSARVTYYSSTRTITVTGSGHNISVSDGAFAIFASGRVMFSMTPSLLMSDGRMYVPLGSLARALSLSAEGGKTRGTVRPVTSAERYYAEDAVYWLSRIISAESRGEPLLGQIAVGNVILNRVKSPSFPNTIWGVIFDRKWGVQFSPVANGTVYNTPSATSVIAAKICLEGFSVSEDALYFIAPAVISSSWIQRTREYHFTVGRHDFYL
jgi:N-acetylmuramoyl-L-alanine amidase